MLCNPSSLQDASQELGRVWNSVSRAGQSQAPTALSTSCSCLAVPGANRVGVDEGKHVGTASCQGRSQPRGHGLIDCSGRLRFVQFNQLNLRESRASARRDQSGWRDFHQPDVFSAKPPRIQTFPGQNHLCCVKGKTILARRLSLLSDQHISPG